MDTLQRAENSQNCRELQGNPLLSGRGERVVDGLFWENVVALRPDPESESDRKT